MWTVFTNLPPQSSLARCLFPLRSPAASVSTESASNKRKQLRPLSCYFCGLDFLRSWPSYPAMKPLHIQLLTSFILNRVTSNWGEGNGSDHAGSPGGPNQATWNNRFGSGSPWATAGGDFSSTVSASESISGFGPYTFGSTANLVADVQAWLDNPASNFGLADAQRIRA